MNVRSWVLEMENARDGGSISKTLRSHYHVIGTPLYHTNACEALNVALQGREDTMGNTKLGITRELWPMPQKLIREKTSIGTTTSIYWRHYNQKSPQCNGYSIARQGIIHGLLRYRILQRGKSFPFHTLSDARRGDLTIF